MNPEPVGPTAEEPPYEVGHLLASRYRLRALIGSGPSGALYLAADTATLTEAAVKVVWPDVVPTDQDVDGLLDHLRRAGSVVCPPLARVRDVFEDFGYCVLVRDCPQGPSLRTQVGRRQQEGEGERRLTELAAAVATLHRAGVVHGNLKPENVFAGSGGVTLTDPRPAGLLASGALHGGTAPYSAPEVRAGAAPDPRADVYALGVIAAELLGASESGASVSTLPAALGEALARATAERAEDRHLDAGAFQAAVEAATQKTPRLLSPHPEAAWTEPAGDPTTAVEAAAEPAAPRDTPGYRPARMDETAVDTRLEVGQLVGGRYLLQALLGTGPLGAVYLADDRDNLRQVALKVIWAEILPGQSDRRRFVEQASRARTVLNRYVGRVFEAFDDGLAAVALQHFAGSTVRGMITRHRNERSPLPSGEARGVISQLGLALTAIHDAGFAHGNVKPENIVLTEGGTRLTDFGVALGLPPVAFGRAERQVAGGRFVPPEVAGGASPDVRSDVFGLSVTAAELLAAMRRPIPTAAAEVVRRACAPDPRDRRATAADFVAALFAALDGEAPKAATPAAQAQPGRMPLMALEDSATVPFNRERNRGAWRRRRTPATVAPRAAPMGGAAAALAHPRSQAAFQAAVGRPAARPLATVPGPRRLPTVAAVRVGSGGMAVRAAAAPAVAWSMAASAPLAPSVPILAPSDNEWSRAVAALWPRRRPSAPPLSSRSTRITVPGWRSPLAAASALLAVAVLVLGSLLVFDEPQPLTLLEPPTSRPRELIAAPTPPPPTAGSLPPPAAVPAAPPAPLPAGAGARPRGSCPEGMVRLPGPPPFCIARFEYPGVDVMPRTWVSWAEADTICRAEGGRLCGGVEWEQACSGRSELPFPYGDRPEESHCNTRPRDRLPNPVAPAGSYPLCRTDTLLHDMAGNVAEWVAEGEVRGGSMDTRTARARCSSVRPLPVAARSPVVGVRCCADPAP